MFQSSQGGSKTFEGDEAASPSRENPMAAKKKRQDPFREIQNCLQKRDYKGALGWFQKLLEKEEKNTQIRLRYADTLVLAGSKNEAIKQYRIVADELAESGFMIRAIAISKKIVKLDPRQTDAHQKLAEMNEARSKGRSAAMAQLSAAIVSDPAMETPPSSPASAPVAAPPPQSLDIEEPEPRIEAEPRSEPTMSLEDSMAMEFGAPGQGITDASGEAAPEDGPAIEYEIAMEQAPVGADSPETTQPVESPEPSLPETMSDPTLESVPGAEDEELILGPIDEDEASGPLLVPAEGDPEITFDASAPLEPPGQEDPSQDFEIVPEPVAAADGADPLVGVLGEDIDALIDSIIDDVGSSASAPPSPPPQSTESPGGIPLFSQLTMQEFIDVAVVLDRRSVKAGTVIVREGDPGDSMFIVSTGQVDATVESDGKTVKVHSFKDGDFFGEMAVLSGQPRTATVTAVKSTELLELSRDNLHGIFSKHPEVEAKIRLAYDERAMNPPK